MNYAYVPLRKSTNRHQFNFCISCFSELFSLKLAALWTAVLGEWDREVDENTEVRIPIENIIVHEHFHNYQHDIGKNVFLFQNNILSSSNKFEYFFSKL